MDEEIKTGMVVDETMKSDLLCAAKWAKFLLVLSVIGLVFLFVVGIVMIFFGSKFDACSPDVQVGPNPCPFAGGIGVVTGIIYLVLAAILVYPVVKGFQFANGTKAACLTNSEAQLARGFAGLRSYLKFYGILTIIFLIVYALIIVAGIVFATMHGPCPAPAG